MSAPMVTAFRGHQLLAAGPLREVARIVWRAVKDPSPSNVAVLVFDDATGRVIDLEMRGDERDMLAHLDATAHSSAEVRADGESAGGSARPRDDEVSTVEPTPRGRGRPKLGVVAREVTLLPRHWEWLATQPGGASVALRRVVDAARRTNADDDRAKESRDAAFRFMNAMAGDLIQYEEVLRALYRHDEVHFRELMDPWPTDIRAYAERLAFPSSANQERAT